MRLKGTGFDVEDHDISIGLSAGGVEPRQDKDFMVTKLGNDDIMLKLLKDRKWVDFSSRNPPVELVLTSVTFANKPGVNLLSSPVLIANLLVTPTVMESTEAIYQTATKELVIQGSGFVGAKYVDIYFDPPRVKDIYYEVVSTFPLSGNEVVVRLRHGYQWNRKPGPLSVVGIDTGGGPVKLNGDVGFKVAEVLKDIEVN